MVFATFHKIAIFDQRTTDPTKIIQKSSQNPLKIHPNPQNIEQISSKRDFERRRSQKLKNIIQNAKNKRTSAKIVPQRPPKATQKERNNFGLRSPRAPVYLVLVLPLTKATI